MNEDTTHPKQRTGQQNKALHKFYEMLAQTLNEAGLEMKVLLKPNINIWWTKDSVKDYLWRPIQEAMYGTNSTTFLRKHEQIDKVHQVLMRELGEKHGVEYIEFPSDYEDVAPLKDKSYEKL
jgi:hypothetical protein